MLDLDPTWESYRRAESRGLRREYLAALQDFVDAWRSSHDGRTKWLANHLEEATSGPIPLRRSLLDAVLPHLVKEARQGDLDAARHLAQILSSSKPVPWEVWEQFSPTGRYGVAEEFAVAFPSVETFRRIIVEDDLRYIEFTLHELPAGVLIDADGASEQECEELLTWLDEVQLRMSNSERERAAGLIQKAKLHYRMYAAYLRSGTRSGYAAFLAQERTG